MRTKIETGILIILLLSNIISFIYTQLTIYIVNIQFYLGLSSVILILIIRIKFLRLSKIFIGILLISGTFNLILFSHITIGVSEISFINLKKFGLEINPIILFLLLLFILINGKNLTNNAKRNKEDDKEQIQNEISYK